MSKKEQPKVINRWLDNDAVYIYNGLLFSPLPKKKKEIFPFVTTLMDLEAIMVNERC